MKLTKAFLEEIRGLIVSARTTVARGVDLVQVHTNFEIGRRIVQQEQKGKGRAGYGDEVIKTLAQRLTMEFGRGFSKRNLDYFRRFYLEYVGCQVKIVQILSAQLAIREKGQALTDFSQIFRTLSGESHAEQIVQTLSAQSGISQSLRGKSPARTKAQSAIGQLTSSRKSQTESDELALSQMYVNYFDREVKIDDERSTIGIILCKQKNKALVEITLPKDANIHAREYQLYLPSKEELQQKLVEWTKAREAGHV